MDGTHHLRAEEVREVGGDRREATAVHGEDHPKEQHEERKTPGGSGPGYRAVKHDAEDEEERVGRLAPDPVGEGGPEDPSGDIEERQKPGEASRDGGDTRQL